ncbi:acyl-CoA dehydrogenase family protein [Bosea caraganae]|nr:acyl-CoA dehydrogenase family protein [Bosea caraganae]
MTLNKPEKLITESPVDRAIRLAPMAAAAAPESERLRRLAQPLVDALVEAGLFRLLMPASVGGEEVSPTTFLSVLEVMANADASTAWCLSQTSVCSTAAASLKLEVAREIFADPGAILASGFGGGQALLVSGGHLISGNWSFGSGSRHATWLAGSCTLCDAGGTPLRNANGQPMARMMLFPQGMATFSETWEVMGLKGTGSDSYAVSELFVPESHSFQFGALAQPHARSPLYALPPDSLWAGGFGSASLGVAQGMLDALIALAQEKTVRGQKRPLSESPVVQALVAEADARLRAARMLLHGTFSEVWAAMQSSGTIDLAQRVSIRLAASHAIQEAKTVVEQCYHAAGTSAVFTSAPFERRFRDMHMISQHLHGRRAHFETVGQFMLGLSPDVVFL